MKIFALLIALISITSCSKLFMQPITGCQSDDELTVYCGFQNPEDLALTPDEKFLIVSEFGGMSPLAKMSPGKLSLFDLQDKIKLEASIIFGGNEWGSRNCTRDHNIPFGPHGIDLITRKDGRYQLAVVSHYPTESVEMFELQHDENWFLEWKGCINVENKYYFNDVSLDDSGNFYATHMFDSNYSMVNLAWNVFAKSNTGLVVKWINDNKFEELEYTAGSFPNGIALDQENNNLVVNYNFGDKTVLFDLDNQKQIGVFERNSPDNVIIKDDFVWVANHDHSALSALTCGKKTNCTLPFSINQLALDSLSLIKSYNFQSYNMGIGTIGLPHRGFIWIGSYRSDRIARAQL